MNNKISDCIFCSIPIDRIILENELTYAIRDNYPVTSLHSLIIPKRHVVNYFSLTKDELLSCDFLLKEVKSSIQTEDESVEGFNIGINSGEVAGQTIFHSQINQLTKEIKEKEQESVEIENILFQMNKAFLDTLYCYSCM